MVAVVIVLSLVLCRECSSAGNEVVQTQLQVFVSLRKVSVGCLRARGAS
jgi:hypothetical protein